MQTDKIINWLLEGDVSIQYQMHRDLFGDDRKDLQQRIAEEGWGAEFLKKRKANGHWGQKFYQPKWTSTHYTLLDLKNLALPQYNPQAMESVRIILKEEKGPDGGIRPIGSVQASDVCINGMFLNYACWFGAPEKELESVVDFILSQRMKDGGFNCRSNRSGAVHSSLHTTISVLEGITEYQRNGYGYKIKGLEEARLSALEFILKHRLFLSDHTGKVIHKDFLKLTYPGRWRYDILRALDYFQYSGISWDERMEPAMEVLLKKRNNSGTWNVQAKHSGQMHFEMEKAGRPSHWNTLRARRVLQHFEKA